MNDKLCALLLSFNKIQATVLAIIINFADCMLISNKNLKSKMTKCMTQLTAGSARYFLALFVAVAFLFSLPAGLIAQETEEEKEEDPWADVDFPYEDEVLLAFFDTNQEVSALQRSTNERIEETLAGFGLTRQRFDQIGRAAQMGALQDGAFSNEEIEAFNQVAPQVTEIQREMQGMVQVIVQDNDMSMQEYREILNSFRGDQELQQYVSHLARERARQKILEERRREAERKMEEERRQQEEEEG